MFQENVKYYLEDFHKFNTFQIYSKNFFLTGAEAKSYMVKSKIFQKDNVKHEFEDFNIPVTSKPTLKI